MPPPRPRLAAPRRLSRGRRKTIPGAPAAGPNPPTAERLPAHPPPPPQNYEMDTWEDLGLVQKLQTKSNGYFMYFKRDRECLDKYLPRVKLFEYAEEKDHK